MSVTTTVTPGDIATALGRPAPSSTVADQWQMWIDDAAMLIGARADELGVTTIDQVKVDYVIREAVVAQVRRPDDATQVTKAVDDGSVTKTYKSSRGRVSILDEWWALLGLARGRGRAFEVDTTPPHPGVHGVDYWWRTPTEWLPLP